MVGITQLAASLLAAASAVVASPTPAQGPSSFDGRGPINFNMGLDHHLSKRFGNFSVRALDPRSNTNYVQNYHTGGTVNFSPSTNSFTLNFNTQNDFVVGVGWNPGSTAPITHSGSFAVNSGLGSLGVYGWTTNPLVEYYIMQTNHGISTGGTQKGTVTSDGATYAIWEHQQVNQPSIQGTSTFQQYISIRNSPTTSGTITLENHFKAWAALGMNLGTMNFQVIAVESWSGSGSASQTISNTGTGSTNPPPSSSSSNPPPSQSSTSPTGCSAIWGQCGGNGWTGPKCCSSGTCHYQNDWYSQCS